MPVRTTERVTRSVTVSVVLALTPEPSVAVIVAVPAPRPVARPPASMVATAPLLLVHPTPVPATVTGVEDPVVAPFPSWPKSLFGPTAPQHFTVPFERSAQVCRMPALTATAPVTPPTRTGVDELVVVPSPSCPSAFRPQHCTVPSERSAQVCWNPPLTAVALGSPATRSGVRVPMVLPLPSCPSAFRPQHCTVPSPSSAQV